MKRVSILFAACLLFVSGCVTMPRIEAKLYVPNSILVPAGLKDAQIEAAIIAGIRVADDWVVESSEPRSIVAGIQVRAHYARVQVSHDGNVVKLTLLRTRNLQESRGYIHPNFNRWYENLEKNIRIQVSNAKYR